MQTIEPKVLYLRRSEINGPIELCVGTGDHRLDAVYVLRAGLLINLVLDGIKLLFRSHIDPMWLAEFQYPERIGNGRDGKEA